MPSAETYGAFLTVRMQLIRCLCDENDDNCYLNGVKKVAGWKLLKPSKINLHYKYFPGWKMTIMN